MDEIHIWDFPYKVSVSLNPKFLDKINSERKNNKKKINGLYNELKLDIPFSYFKNNLKPSFSTFRDLQILVLVCRNLFIPLNELEDNIIAYRTARGRTFISAPLLPVKVNPLFPMLIAHTIADGNAVKIDGRETYFNYRQYNKLFRDLFIRKTERLFGKLNYQYEYFDSLQRIYLPTAISLILSGYYKMNVEDFLSDRARLPEIIFNNKEQMIAVLVAFIIDEGNIDSAQIVIRLKNPLLVQDLFKICEKLGYESIVTKQDKPMPCLYILAEGVKKFWKDFLQLKKEYPEIAMGYKEEAIQDFILRKKKIWRSVSEGETKNKIIELLSEKPLTVNELAKLFSISRQGVRYHIRYLEKANIIKRQNEEFRGKKSLIYILLKKVKFKVKRKGRSYQEGATKEKIISLLKDRQLSTKEVSQELNIQITTSFSFLHLLEKENKVKRVGVKVHKTHPSVVWTLV